MTADQITGAKQLATLFGGLLALYVALIGLGTFSNHQLLQKRAEQAKFEALLKSIPPMSKKELEEFRQWELYMDAQAYRDEHDLHHLR